IEVLAATAENLDAILPAHVRAALLRARAATSLERLVWLQRCQAVRVDAVPFPVTIRRPRTLAQEEQERSTRRQSVLAEVATELKPGKLTPAYEQDAVVARLADVL